MAGILAKFVVLEVFRPKKKVEVSPQPNKKITQKLVYYTVIA